MFWQYYQYTYVKHDVKMAVYWPSSFMYLLRIETKSKFYVHAKEKKENKRGQYQATILTEQAWSISGKDLKCGK